ncbi:MAG TPA: hypothetical protein VH328_09215 [Burkholderiaceae bacterium]|nr:hypothetical protein [Burkholderiaceae bacterium]
MTPVCTGKMSFELAQLDRYLALCRYVEELDTAIVLALRARRESAFKTQGK